jgi:CRISPR-associated endonuclease/helicase Cas3
MAGAKLICPARPTGSPTIYIRHDRDGQRPKGFDAAKAIVLTPFDFDASLAAVTRDRNGPHGLGGLVYGNLVSLAATRERIGGGAAWTIPSMNRELVEAATHPVTLEALKDRLASRGSVN